MQYTIPVASNVWIGKSSFSFVLRLSRSKKAIAWRTSSGGVHPNILLAHLVSTFSAGDQTISNPTSLLCPTHPPVPPLYFVSSLVTLCHLDTFYSFDVDSPFPLLTASVYLLLVSSMLHFHNKAQFLPRLILFFSCFFLLVFERNNRCQ